MTWDQQLHPTGELAGMPLDDPFGPARWQLAGEDEDAVINEFSQLAVDSRPAATGPRDRSPPRCCGINSPSCCSASRC